MPPKKKGKKKGKGKGKGRGRGRGKGSGRGSVKNKGRGRGQVKKKNQQKKEIKEVIKKPKIDLKPLPDPNMKIVVGKGAVKEQTSPPTIPVRELYPEGNFPKGVFHEYINDNSYRTSSKEMQNKDRMVFSDRLKDLRLAAEVHRQTRQYAVSIIKPGIKLWDMCCKIEDMARMLISEKGLEAGLAFPTGCSLNHVAAHYTPNKGDDTILGESDVMKVDFGTHVNGYVIDSAFSVCFDPRYDTLLKASQEATNLAVKLAGIDARFSEIGAGVQELIESFELEIDGKTHPLFPVKNLNGHSLDQYVIHSGKSVPLVGGGSEIKMEEGEMYALETFATSGTGIVKDCGECSHYMVSRNSVLGGIRNNNARKLYGHLKRTFGTLAFCPRWIDRTGQSRYGLHLKNLVKGGVVRNYPPLGDNVGSFVSQFEHTLILRPNGKEVLSRGTDY
ncbi:methionine aminopeptidase 2 [Anaeramoeba flamelloides]|uniref:Methionine aminopeptidase 2 n=1 Tax=Anaeramoeba flamelloides TaxID=1746091 RepID=A0ABQ8Z9D6_9EUKA|nr:methionine aminopeptidase 2 [Anaeramoeba flamelloides]